MKLWILRPGENRKAWEPWCYKAFGFVVRAETEEQARAVASEEGGAENYIRVHPRDASGRRVFPWLDPAQSTCVELSAEGPVDLVIRDFCAA